MGQGDVLARIERRLGAHAGLRMPSWLLSSRVSERMRALGLQSMDEYVERLESRGELDALSESLRVGETSFFRHKAHMGALRRVVAPDLAARHAEDRRVRAWSAGCASGEEPFTLAMLLAEAMPPERGWRVEVLATDISEEALEVARRGRYPLSALKNVPTLMRERWFARAGDAWQVGDELQRMVRFERKNLMDPHWGVRGMDVILCRNVLIYFDAEARRATAHRLIECLASGGYLFFGYAESLREFERLEALRAEDGAVYRRPLKGRLELGQAAPGAGLPQAPGSRLRQAPGSRLQAPGTEAGATAGARSLEPGARSPEPPRAGSREPGAGAGAGAGVRRPEAGASGGTVTLRLTGAHEKAQDVAELLRRAIAGATRGVILDLDGAEYLADEIAGAIRRAAAAAVASGLSFEVRAARPGPRRFVARHQLGRPS